jgi:hypothetical protein
MATVLSLPTSSVQRAKAQPLAPHGEIGNGRADESRGDNVTPLDRGNSQTYLLRRLARDAPEVLERLEQIEAAHGNHAADAPLPMRDPLARVLVAVFGLAPPKRPVLLRPRPAGLPHPIRRLPRLPGVVRP